MAYGTVEQVPPEVARHDGRRRRRRHRRTSPGPRCRASASRAAARWWSSTRCSPRSRCPRWAPTARPSGASSAWCAPCSPRCAASRGVARQPGPARRDRHPDLPPGRDVRRQPGLGAAARRWRPTRVAEACVRCLDRPRRMVHVGPVNRLAVAGYRLAPGDLRPRRRPDGRPRRAARAGGRRRRGQRLRAPPARRGGDRRLEHARAAEHQRPASSLATSLALRSRRGGGTGGARFLLSRGSGRPRR